MQRVEPESGKFHFLVCELSQVDFQFSHDLQKGLGTSSSLREQAV
jgi:hypothetical protein